MSNPLPKLDHAPDAARRKTMAAVKSKNTTPEMRVRKAAHRLGRRFRLHDKLLPGKPDLVFPRLKKAIFVHGCFWHGHDCQRGARTPKTNRAYWIAKIDRNRSRDNANLIALKAKGWDVAVIWECETKNEQQLTHTLRKFLEVDC
jgi:DNA mismatch endonuclease (patch repair protein)